MSLNAHYRLRVPFSLDHVHLLAHPVWVVVMRAGVRSATKERPSPYRNLRVDGPHGQLERSRAWHLTSSSHARPRRVLADRRRRALSAGEKGWIPIAHCAGMAEC